MKLIGLFHCRDAFAAHGIDDTPYSIFGSNVIAAEDTFSADGVIACAVGQIRNMQVILGAAERAGLPIAEPATQSAVVLYAYQLWGAEYPERIEGAVMTAVIDRASTQLIVSRDRMGQQLLFYARSGRTVAFADHPAALIESRMASRVVDRDGVCELFALGPARTPGRTPYRDIFSLEPGTKLLADRSGLRVKQYFALTALPHTDNEETTIDKVRMLVTQAVDDVAVLKPCAMLSGGLDSTVLTALLQKRTAAPVRTFSIDYEDNEQHFTGTSFQPTLDAPFVRLAVDAIGCTHTRVVLTQNSLVEALEESTRVRGFPGMADIDTSLMLFAREISAHATYALSGECGDEVFGGYPWFRETREAVDSFPWSGSLALRESILKKDLRAELNLRDYADARLHESLKGLPQLPSDSPSERYLRQLQGLCFQYFMTNLQERAVRMCEAFGVNVLTPFCDDRLVSYVYNVPWSMKFLGGQEKGLLRAAMRGLLPDTLLKRKKSPYPKTYHPEYAALVRAKVVKMLADPDSPILALVDKEAVLAIAAGDLSPATVPWFGQLMAGPQMLAYLYQVNDWLIRNKIELAI